MGQSWPTAGSANYCPGFKSTLPSVFVNELLWEHIHTPSFMHCWVVVTETIWPAKPKIFTTCAFAEKVCWSSTEQWVLIICQPLCQVIYDLTWPCWQSCKRNFITKFYKWGSKRLSNWPKVTQLVSKFQSWDLNLCQSEDETYAIISTLRTPTPAQNNPPFLLRYRAKVHLCSWGNQLAHLSTGPERNGGRFGKESFFSGNLRVVSARLVTKI